MPLLPLQQIPTTYFLFALILVFIIIVIARNRFSGLEHIPGPFLARYTDALRAFMAWKGEALSDNVYLKMHGQYGDVVRIGPRSVSVRDSEAIPLIYGIKARLNRGLSMQAFQIPGVPPSILTIRDGETHARYRRPIQGVYSLSNLKSYEPDVDEILNILIGIFDQFDRKNEAVNISIWAYYYSYDTVGKLTFGQPIGYLEKGADVHGLIKRQRQFHGYLNVVTQMPSLHPLLMNNPILRVFPRRTEDFITFTQHRVQERLSKHDPTDRSRPDLLSHFIQLRESYPGLVDEQQILIYTLTNVVAGSLSASRVLDEIVKYLVGHPQAQSYIHDEVKAAGLSSGGMSSPVSIDLAKKSPYLEGVFLEGCRLHERGNLSSDREVSADGLVLPSGHYLPPGTFVEVNFSSTYLDTEIYGANPENFEPRRWIQKPEETTDAFLDRRAKMDRALTVFGHGSRSCLGKNFAQLKILKLVATLCDRYLLEGVGKPELYSVWTRVKLREKTL